MPTDDNPYAPPRVVDRAIGVTSGRDEALKTVAVAQKLILVCIGLRILGSASQYFLHPEYRFFVEIALYCTLVVSAVGVFILAKKVGLGIVYGIVALIPYIGMISLLIVDRRATKILRDNGHRVGLFGADLSEL